MEAYMLKSSFLFSTFVGIITIGLSSCASISEDSCRAGNWEALGYKDGTNGVKRNKVSSYADRCSKFGISLDMDEYLTGFNAGLPTYCTYERGFSLGENGSSYNQVCSGLLAVDFAPGYDAGRVVYEIYQEHNQLIAAYEDKLDAVSAVRERLDTEDLSGEDIKRLKKKLRLFKRDADNIRIDIRAFEGIHDLSRYDF